MSKKMVKDPNEEATGIGGTIGCLSFIIISYMVVFLGFSFSFNIILMVSVVTGCIAYFFVKGAKAKESKREDLEVYHFVTNTISSSSASDQLPPHSKIIDKPIQSMYRATYFGGHKKYGEKADVSVVLTKDRLLLKELQGHSETRVDVPYVSIIDFGIATKEQLTVTRMFLVGILAFALKKQQQYFYVKYKDKMGFEHNPVLGEFVGTNISEMVSKLYELIELTRG